MRVILIAFKQQVKEHRDSVCFEMKVEKARETRGKTACGNAMFTIMRIAWSVNGFK